MYNERNSHGGDDSVGPSDRVPGDLDRRCTPTTTLMGNQSGVSKFHLNRSGREYSKQNDVFVVSIAHSINHWMCCFCVRVMNVFPATSFWGSICFRTGCFLVLGFGGAICTF